MRNFLVLLLLFTIKINSVLSQGALLKEFPSQNHFLTVPTTEQFNLQIIGTLNETLDHVFDSITALTPIKGFNAAMHLPDGSIWKRARGLATDDPDSIPLSTDHLMGMGSITKSFVSATLLLLYEDGLIGLGDSIGMYVGPYPNVPGKITIRQLLSHRSGLNDYLNENPAMTNAWLTHVDSIWVIDTILNHYVLSPNFPPGVSWSYSNTNYLLAGRIIENITGMPWHQVVRERILDPLGLTHTFAFPWETSGNQPFSHVWADFDGNGTVEDLQELGLPAQGLFSIASSAGCLITTPEDLVIFSQQLYGGEVLKPSTLAEMQINYYYGSGLIYGLGTSSYPAPQQLENWGHGGNILYKSLALHFPTEDLSIAVQQNDDRTYNPNDLNPILDFNQVFVALLEAYLNYLPVSTIHARENDNKDLVIFPNPAAETFFLQFPDKTQIDFPLPYIITDLTGRIMDSKRIEHIEDEIFIGQLPQGVYVVRVDGFTGKVVKN